MNYNKAKHQVLKLLLDVKLNFIEEYHDDREALLTLDDIVKKQKLDYDTIKVILASLSANQEIRFHTFYPEYDFSGYLITNSGIYAYEDEKYLRIKTERSRAFWSFIISIISFLLSIFAILIAIQEPKQEFQTPKNIISKDTKLKNPLPIKIDDSLTSKNKMQLKVNSK
jgi:hypothetical protein